MAYKLNIKNGSTIVGSSENDIIAVYKNNDSINSGKGNDAIGIFFSNNLTVSSGVGDDTIYNEMSGNNVINYSSGDGNDVIFGLHSNDTLNIVSGSYTTQKSGKDVAVKVGTGSIMLKNAADKQLKIKNGNSIATINPTSGLYITNMGKDSLVTGSSYNDIIYNFYKNNVTLIGGAGDDTIYSTGSNSNINGGNGNDHLIGFTSKIDGGAGNDAISASYSTINTGEGNDTVISGGHNIIQHNKGNDVIISGYGDDLLKIASNSYTTQKGSFELIENDDDDDPISEAISKAVNVVLNSVFDTIIINVSNGDSVTLIGAGQFRIEKANGTVDTLEANSYSTIESTSRYIHNDEYNKTLISGSVYDDRISNLGSYVTINAGKGNDKITLEEEGGGDNVINYTSGDSHKGIETLFGSYTVESSGDVIYGIKTNDLLNITSGTYTTSISGRGQDVVVSVDGNPITLKEAANRQFRIKNASGSIETLNTTKGKFIANSKANSVVTGSSHDDTIRNSTDYTFSDTTTIEELFSLETLEPKLNEDISNVTINAGAGNDSIYNDSDQVTINGDAGNDTIENYGYNVVINGSSGNDLILLGYDYEEIIYNSYYYDDDEDDYEDEDEIYEYDGDHLFEFGFTTIKYAEGDGNDTIYGYDGTDTINITQGNYSTQESGNDVIIKVGTGSICLKDAKGVELNISKGSKITNGGGGSATTTTIATSVTLTDATLSPYVAASTVKNINASSRTKATKINGNNLANSIVGGSGADSISGGAGADTIKGGKGNDNLSGGTDNDKLLGDAGADTLNGGKGNDTLTGGAGKDVFFFASSEGNDVITDYSSAQGDLIRLGTSSMSTSMSGNNVILKVVTGKITVNNAKSQQVSVIGSTGKSTIIGGATTLNVTNSTKSPVTTASTIKVIDASKRTTAVKLTGNSLANTIKGGSAVDTIYGGAGNDSILGNNGNDKLFGDNGNDTIRGGVGNDSISGGAGADKLYGDNGADTLNGGKGNDTLTGGNGNDVFVYANGDGNVVITDYTIKQDKIKLTNGTISSSSLKGSDVVLKIGSGSITIKNGKNKSITVVDSKNKSTSKVYGSSSKNYIEEHWFIKDNNFFNDEINAIVSTSSDYANASMNNNTLNYGTNILTVNKQPSIVYYPQDKK